MADDPQTQPISEAERLKRIADLARQENNHLDIAKELLDVYRKIEGSKEQQVNFGKIILKNAEIRRGIQETIYSEIESTEKRLLKLQAQKIKNGEYENELQQNIDALSKRVNETEEGRKMGIDEMKATQEEIVALEEQQKMGIDAVIKAEKQRRQELITTSKELQKQAGYLAYLRDQGHGILEIFGKWTERIGQFWQIIKRTPAEFLVMEAALLSVGSLLLLGTKRFAALDSSAEKFRRETGFTTLEMATIRTDAEQINKQFSYMGIGMEQVYKSAKALTDVFGRTSLVTKDAMQNVALLSANFGVAEEDSANVLSIFQGLGGVSQDVAMNIIGWGAELSDDKHAGVSFSAVMKDIANVSSETSMILGSNPVKLMKTAIAARALGLDINKIASSQKKLLEYSTSINAELEASALLGRSITFQKARQLAYDGKLVDAARATLDSIKEAGDWNSLTVYQRQALAEASGMDLKDITKALAVDKQRRDILNGSDKDAAAQLRLQDAEIKKLEERNSLDADDVNLQGKKYLENLRMQGLLTQLQGIGSQLLITLSDILEPLITPLVKVVMPTLQGISKFLESTESKIPKWIKSIGIVGLALFGVGGAGFLFSLTKKVVSSAHGAIMNLTTKALSHVPVIGGLFKQKDAVDSVEKAATKSRAVQTKSGAGLKDFLSNLASGLKAMGTPRVLFGAVNLLLASPGLITIIPGALLSGLIPKAAGERIESFLKGLAKGINAMGTGRITGGSANLLLASIGLITIIPGAVVAAVLGVVGKLIESGLKYLAKGISYMGSTEVFKGALGIAAVGASIIPFAFAMKMFSGVDWRSVGIGSLALIGFTAAAFGLGALLSTGVGAVIFGAGVIGMAALGLALVPFGVAAIAAGLGIKLLASGIKEAVDPIERLSKINLTSTAFGIAATAAALAAFGAGSAMTGIGSLVGKLLGGDPMKKLERLASMGDQLKETAYALVSISQSLSGFGSVNSFASAIDVLVVSLEKLNTQLASMEVGTLDKLSALSTSPAGIGGVVMPASTATKLDTSALEGKVDKLIDLMVGGYITAVVDVDKLSSKQARRTGT